MRGNDMSLLIGLIVAAVIVSGGGVAIFLIARHKKQKQK